MIRRLLFVLLCAATLSACFANSHIQEDGTYDFRFTEADVVKDTCGQLASLPTVGTEKQLWGGNLTVLGDTVRLRYGLFDNTMVGAYLERAERFTLDGSQNNVTVDIASQECLVDIATMHMEASTRTPDQFTGFLSVRYDTRLRASCNCEFIVQYRADRQP